MVVLRNKIETNLHIADKIFKIRPQVNVGSRYAVAFERR